MYRSVAASACRDAAAERMCRRAGEHAAENGTEGNERTAVSYLPARRAHIWITQKTLFIWRAAAFWAWNSSCSPFPAFLTPRAATPTGPARRTPTTRPSAGETPASGRPCGWSTTPEQVSLDALLLAYFYVIDPTVEKPAGKRDIGSQYQTGVYYTNDSTRGNGGNASPKSSGTP